MKDEPTRDEWEFAEVALGATDQLAKEGDSYGKYMRSILNKYYPGNRKKQVRVLGFLNDIYPRRSIPEEEAQILAEKWGIEDLLLKERGFGGISLS